MNHRAATVNFEQNGSQLNAVEIDHSSPSPRVAALHGALFALGIVICTYQIRASAAGYVERVVISRLDGGAIEGKLLEDTRAVILPIAMRDDALREEFITVNGCVAT
ncbi:MAG TPA: hypothetical protein VL137_11805 [Polyangiaceae bacterium]|nr:hypothetical protein [Polyangiaceae bacterium]